LVVGAGIIGLASAYHIKLQDPSANVLIVDKAPAAGQGNTAKSAGGVRNLFSSEISQTLADTSISFYADQQEKRGIDLGLRLIGYLWLVSGRQFKKFESIEDNLHRAGAQFKLWNADELLEMMPDFRPMLDADDPETRIMNLDDVAMGIQGIRSGIVDVEKLVRFYEEQFRNLRGNVLYGVPVERLLVEPRRRIGIDGEPFEWQDKVISGVKTPRGEIRARKLVIAPGAWGRELLDPIGVDCHMNPVRKMIFVLRGSKAEGLLMTRGFNEYGIMPLTILPKGGVYLRPVPREAAFYTAMTEDLGRAFAKSEYPAVEESFYIHNLNPVLSKYFPTLKGLRPSNMWAGRQDWGSMDRNPYVFERGGAVIALATAGNGISRADAIGRIVAALSRGEKEARLYGAKKFEASKLGELNRVIEREGPILE